MPTVNERMRDYAIARQVDLLRLSNAEARRLAEILRGADEVLEARIRRALAVGTPSGARLVRLRQLVRSALDAAHAQVRDGLKDYLQELTRDSAEAEVGALRRAVAAINVTVELPNVSALAAALRSTPMHGVLLNDWVRRLSRNDFERTWATVLRGLTLGQTTDEVVRAVVGSGALRFRDGVREVSRRGVEALVRTATNHAATEARQVVWTQNERLLRGVQWVSTLDARTTAICQALDKRVFPVNEGPRPPAHFNCRSTIVPVLKGWRALGGTDLDAGTRASMDGQVPAALSYEEWLRRRSDSFQDEVLGPARAKLFRQGGLSLDRFVNDRGQKLTLAELRRRSPGAFDEAGL